MPQPKTKVSDIHTAEPKTPAATPVAPEPRPLSHTQEFNASQQEYKARAEKLKAMFAFLESGSNLEMFEYLQIIADHDHGSTTPVEEFITNLIFHYGWLDRDGRGLTIDWIESELETLRTNLGDAIEVSHFMAARYPRPQ